MVTLLTILLACGTEPAELPDDSIPEMAPTALLTRLSLDLRGRLVAAHRNDEFLLAGRWANFPHRPANVFFIGLIDRPCLPKTQFYRRR